MVYNQHMSLCRCQFFARTLRLAALLCAFVLLLPIGRAHEQAAVKVFMYTQDLKRDPANVELRLARGRALAELSRTDEAAADFKRVLELDPSLDIALFEMGALLDRAERYAEALEWFDRYANAEPELAGAHLWRGRTLAKLDRNAEAISAYTRSIELSAQPSPESFSELAVIHARAGEAGRLRAIETLDDGIKRVGFIITLELRALDFELAGNDTSSALIRLDRIIAKSPRKETYLARKAEILRTAGRNEEARVADVDALHSIEALSHTRRTAPTVKELESKIRTRLAQTETSTKTP